MACVRACGDANIKAACAVEALEVAVVHAAGLDEARAIQVVTELKGIVAQAGASGSGHPARPQVSAARL